jgi:urease gamma subunit
VPTPLGLCYHDTAARVHRQLLANMLKLVHPEPNVRVALPSNARISLMRQAATGRFVLHVMYAAPHPRGSVQVLEDAPEFRDVQVTVRLPDGHKLKRVVVGGKVLPHKPARGCPRFFLPRLRWHEAVVLETA